MAKKLSKLQSAQKKAEAAVKETNKKINELGECAGGFYDSLTALQALFDRIRNVPKESIKKYEKLKARQVDWKQQVDKIELEYKKAEVKAAGQGATGVGAGIAVVTLGPTAAMGVATTFGVASTGTAISTLSGAAATNAALAWLGGGALTAGGGGMVAGHALLALAGPIGWTISGISIFASGLMFIKTLLDKDRLENIYTLISIRDVKSYEQAIIELSERITRIRAETETLAEVISKIRTFGTDYDEMTVAQQYELGACVNLMESDTMLLIDPISGLQPKFTEQDFDRVCEVETEVFRAYLVSHKKMVIYMANLLFKITIDQDDKKLLAKSLKKNKEFLASAEMTKKEFDENDITKVEKILNHRYGFRP